MEFLWFKFLTNFRLRLFRHLHCEFFPLLKHIVLLYHELYLLIELMLRLIETKMSGQFPKDAFASIRRMATFMGLTKINYYF
jgi:hypothetical protein